MGSFKSCILVTLQLYREEKEVPWKVLIFNTSVKYTEKKSHSMGAVCEIFFVALHKR